MYDLTNEGFSAQVGEKRIVFRNENFRDGGNEYEGEAIITEKGRLLFVIRFRTQADWKTRPILIDGEGEEELPDLWIGKLPEDPGEAQDRYFMQIYCFILEQISSQKIFALNEFRIVGTNCVTKTVRAMGSGAGVYLPKEKIGDDVQVIW
jgi:hypothetical protein